MGVYVYAAYLGIFFRKRHPMMREIWYTEEKAKCRIEVGICTKVNIRRENGI
jgi:hypothetical protein